MQRGYIDPDTIVTIKGKDATIEEATASYAALIEKRVEKAAVKRRAKKADVTRKKKVGGGDRKRLGKTDKPPRKRIVSEGRGKEEDAL